MELVKKLRSIISKWWREHIVDECPEHLKDEFR